MKIYVGNLSSEFTEKQLEELFAVYGTVDAAVVVPSGTNRFGFVTMPSEAEARTAINALNRRLVHGRPLRVREAELMPA